MSNLSIATEPLENLNDDQNSELFSDLVLDYINQILMEEEEEEDMGEKYTHPDLQATEKPFYDIIGQKYPPSPSSQSQKANKFLPTNPLDPPKHHLRDESISEQQQQRRSKQSAFSYEEPAVPPEMMDDVLLSTGDKFTKVVNAIKKKIYNDSSTTNNNKLKKKQFEQQVVDLNTLLLHCAQTITAGDSRRANELLTKIRRHSDPLGDASQRLAHYIADGLEARLAGTGSEIYTSLVNKRKTVNDVLKACQLYLATCPFRKLSYHYANQIILNAIGDAKRVHILDFGIYFGFQWPVFIKMLSLRSGGPPMLRITGIDSPQPGFRPDERLAETGRRLAGYADRFGVPFEYRAIAAKFDEVRLEKIDVHDDETLVVNCLFRMHNLADETVVVDCPRDRVLKGIRTLNPAVFVNVIVNGSYGAPFFMTRFREAMYHFSAVFDMLDVTVPRENDERYLLERDMYGRFLINVISCEGLERERPETYKQWQVRCLRAGFVQVPLCQEFFKIVKQRVREYYHKDFNVDEDGKWLLQGWKGRILYGLSAWKPGFL